MPRVSSANSAVSFLTELTLRDKRSTISKPHGKQPRQASFRFLDLPKEIRFEVYEQLWSPSVNPIVSIIEERIPKGYPSKPGKCTQSLRYQIDPKVSHSPNLARANKQIYNEALPFLYRDVIFRPACCASSLLISFLDLQSERARRSIRTFLLRPSDLNRSIYSGKFCWTITCAQVVSLHETVREVQLDLTLDGAPSAHQIRRFVSSRCRPLLRISNKLVKLNFLPEERWSDEDVRRLTSRFYDAMDAERAVVQQERQSRAGILNEAQSESDITLVEENDDFLTDGKKKQKAREADSNMLNTDASEGSFRHSSSLQRPVRGRSHLHGCLSKTSNRFAGGFKRKITSLKFQLQLRKAWRPFSCFHDSADWKLKPPPSDHLHICPCLDNAPGRCNALVMAMPLRGK